MDGGGGQRAPCTEGGPCPQHAVFCMQQAPPGHTPGYPFREDRAGRAGDVEGSSVTKILERGTWPAATPTGGCPVPTGRMKAVRGGSWPEYLSIHCSSSRMRPDSNVVRPEEPRVGHGHEAHRPEHRGNRPVPFHPVPFRLVPSKPLPRPSQGLQARLTGSHVTPRRVPAQSNPCRALRVHTGAQRANYLSEPPGRRSGVSPGQSQRPAGSTGSGEATEGASEDLSWLLAPHAKVPPDSKACELAWWGLSEL